MKYGFWAILVLAGVCLSANKAMAQPYTVGTTLDIGYYQQVEPLSGFGWERVNQPNQRGAVCGIGFGGSVEIIYIMQPNTDQYVVQYTPSNNPQGVLNECEGGSAYFIMSETDLTNQEGIHAAVLANPPQ